jgi:hypothetical protein
MKRLYVVAYGLVIWAGVTSLTACESPTPLATTGSTTETAGVAKAQAPFRHFPFGLARAEPDRHGSPSWVSPGATAQNLLYVSDGGANAVDVYSYPAGGKVGKLTNLNSPAGLCIGSAGALWVVVTGSSEIVEYAHASTKPEATLTNHGASYLLGCAVDPTTGNLAVTDYGPPAGGGRVWVYAGAKGTPKGYTDSNLLFAYFCGYDSNGNLFIDGEDNSREFKLLELPSGSSNLENITLNQSVGFPGGVQWDGKYVAVGDQAYENQEKSAIYQVSISGSAGTVEGTTPLSGSCQVLQFDVAIIGTSSSKVIGPDSCKNAAKFYKYPSGGSPTKTLTGFRYPVGAAMSPANGNRPPLREQGPLPKHPVK